MVRYKILEWDSNFFGIKIAKIFHDTPSSDDIYDILSKLLADNVKLVYWPVSMKMDDEIVDYFRGAMIDTKTTFLTKIGSSYLNDAPCDNGVLSYINHAVTEDLEDLAIQSGAYSRFARDTRIPKELFERLYKTWIKNSLSKEIADEVFVIRDGEKFTGVITLGGRNDRGDIGLLAVDRNYRGMNYGGRLVSAAHKWFSAQGYHYAQVVTQGENVQACDFYTKCGYKIENVEYFYHFWL